jgi:hypothetical protein
MRFSPGISTPMMRAIYQFFIPAAACAGRSSKSLE